MTTEKVRQLLARYYDGIATADETDALMRYFMETAHVEPDLAADAAIFRALARRSPSAPPAGLRERILDSTVRAPRRRSFPHLKVFLAAAACLALIFTLAMSIFKPVGKPVEAPLTASVVKPAVKTEAPAVIPAAAPEPAAAVTEKPRVMRHAASTASVAPAAETESVNYREVTDPAEATDVAMRLLACLDATLSDAGVGMERTQMAVEVINDPLRANEIIESYR